MRADMTSFKKTAIQDRIMTYMIPQTQQLYERVVKELRDRLVAELGDKLEALVLYGSVAPPRAERPMPTVTLICS